MEYFLSDSLLKEIKGKRESEKWEEISLYWKGKDPDLLKELNQRVQYCNNHFSISSPGWMSDRGKIYIKFGRPSSISNSYNDNFRYQYETWIYGNGRKYVFIDRSLSGDYILETTSFY